MKKSTLKIVFAALGLLLLLQPGTAWAGKKRPNACIDPIAASMLSDCRNERSRVASAAQTYRAFQNGKGSYEYRMARWGEYCDRRGDGEALLGAFLPDIGSFIGIPFLGGFASVISREGTKSENSCHYWRTAYMTKYERQERARENAELAAAIDEAVGRHVRAIERVQDKVVTPEVVDEIVRHAVEQQRKMLIEEMEKAAAQAAKQKKPAPKQEKKPDDAPKPEVPAAQAPEPPAITAPAEKPAAEKEKPKSAPKRSKAPAMPSPDREKGEEVATVGSGPKDRCVDGYCTLDNTR